MVRDMNPSKVGICRWDHIFSESPTKEGECIPDIRSVSGFVPNIRCVGGMAEERGSCRFCTVTLNERGGREGPGSYMTLVAVLTLRGRRSRTFSTTSVAATVAEGGSIRSAPRNAEDMIAIARSGC